MTMFIAMTIWAVGFVTGFLCYQGVRVGVREWRNVQNEDKKSFERECNLKQS